MQVLRSAFIDETQVERLKKLSTKTGIPKAALIREGIDLMLEKHERKLERKLRELERR